MTAIGDKLKQADPLRALGAEFYAKATEMLRLRGSVREAWRAMESWGLVQLTRISSEMKGPVKEELGDHHTTDTHARHVSQDGASGGQKNGDTQAKAAAARPTPSSKEPKPFFEQKGASEATKQITRRATLARSTIWHDAKLDKLSKLPWEDAPQFWRDHISAGANSVLKGRNDIWQAAVAFAVYQHGKPSNPRTPLGECVSDKVTAGIFQMSGQQVSRIVAKLQQLSAVEIESGIKLIAAE